MSITKEFTVKSGHAKCPRCSGTDLAQVVEPTYDSESALFMHYIPYCRTCNFKPSPLFYYQETDRRSPNASAYWNLFVILYAHHHLNFCHFNRILGHLFFGSKGEVFPESRNKLFEDLIEATPDSNVDPFTLVSDFAVGMFQRSLKGNVLDGASAYVGYSVAKKLGYFNTTVTLGQKALTIAKSKNTSTLEAKLLLTRWTIKHKDMLAELAPRFADEFTDIDMLVNEPVLHPMSKEKLYGVSEDDLTELVAFLAHLIETGRLVPKVAMVE